LNNVVDIFSYCETLITIDNLLPERRDNDTICSLRNSQPYCETLITIDNLLPERHDNDYPQPEKFPTFSLNQSPHK